MNKLKKILIVFGILFFKITAFSQSFSVTELISLYKMSGEQFRTYVNDKGYIGTSKETKPFFLYYNNSNNQIASVVYYNEVTKENIHAIMWKLNDPFLRTTFKDEMIKKGFKYVRSMAEDKSTNNLFYTTKEYLICLTTTIDVSKKEPANYLITLQSTK